MLLLLFLVVVLFFVFVFLFFALVCERVLIKTHTINIRFVIGPKNILFSGAYAHFSARKILHAGAVKGLSVSIQGEQPCTSYFSKCFFFLSFLGVWGGGGGRGGRGGGGERGGALEGAGKQLSVAARSRHSTRQRLGQTD